MSYVYSIRYSASGYLGRYPQDEVCRLAIMCCEYWWSVHHNFTQFSSRVICILYWRYLILFRSFRTKVWVTGLSVTVCKCNSEVISYMTWRVSPIPQFAWRQDLPAHCRDSRRRWLDPRKWCTLLTGWHLATLCISYTWVLNQNFPQYWIGRRDFIDGPHDYQIWHRGIFRGFC